MLFKQLLSRQRKGRILGVDPRLPQIEKYVERILAPHTRNPTALGGAKYDKPDTSAAPKA